MIGKLKKAVILSDKDITKLIKTYSEYVFRVTFFQCNPLTARHGWSHEKEKTFYVWQFDRHYLYIHDG